MLDTGSASEWTLHLRGGSKGPEAEASGEKHQAATSQALA